MTALEKAAELKVLSRSSVGLVVDPTDIMFDDLTRDTVLIRVKVRNEGDHLSRPTVVRLESAPFGAFVPSRPLATLTVPALKPGASRELRIEAARPHPTSLGDFNRVPPTSVLKALNVSPDEQPQKPGAGFRTLLNLIRRRGTSRPDKKGKGATGPELAPDLWELLGREQPHWAGNINVFIGDRAVERHVAKALRIYSGRTNLAMFVVGGHGTRDAYAFDIVGLDPDWTAFLYDMSSAKALVVGSENRPFLKRQWVEAVGGMMLVILSVRPPMICEDGKLQVHVTRKSCRKTAVVEFNLDPTAQGAGCYVAG